MFLWGSTIHGEESTLAYFGADNRLIYGSYANQGEANAVNRLPDFSTCGYRSGGVAIPEIPVVQTLEPQEGDDTQRIQAAINSVSILPLNANGFRGTLLLKAGRYQVSSTLRITAEGVVLRGEGQDVLGTILEAVTPSDYDVIVIGTGSASYSAQNGTTRLISSSYVPAGAVSFEVENASGFAVGDTIIVQRTPNQVWIDELAMDQWGWTSEGYVVEYERIITAIPGNKITVDVPLVDVIQEKYGGGKIFKPNPIPRIRHCGIENLRMESCYAGDTDESHPWDAIRIVYAQDSWVRGVTARYFAYSCVNVGAYAKSITVEDCAFLDPKSIITGGRRYSFNIESTATRILVQRCYSHESRHDFVLGSKTRGPNAFVDCYADRSHADSGPHHRWSTGTLFDNVYSSNSIAVENREDSGSGHGWSGAQMVFWNCQTSNQKCDAPKGAMNFAIGSYANKQEGSWAPEEPFGWWEQQWQNVSPRSLYFQQLIDRLGQVAYQNVTLPRQREGRIWNEIQNWAGKDRFQPAPIRPGTPKDRPLEKSKPVVFELVSNEGSVILEYQWFEVVGSRYTRIGTNSPLLILCDPQQSDYGRTFFCRVITQKGPYWSKTARIEAITGTMNIATGKPTITSSIYSGSYAPDKAVDNTYSTFWNSADDDTSPWLRLDLQNNVSVGSITFINRATATSSLLARLSDLQIEVMDASQMVLFASPLLNPGNIEAIETRGANGELTYPFPEAVTGRYVRVSKKTGTGQSYSDAQAHIAEIKVFEALPLPAAPMFLSVVAGNGIISLDWMDSTESDFSHYVVYRSTTPETGYIRVAEGLTESNFIDSDNLDLLTRYYYQVRAENNAGHLSGFSNEVSAFPQISPAVPTSLKAASGDGIVHLVWDENTQPDFVEYRLYRSRWAAGGYDLIARMLSSSEFLDSGVDNGKTYYYAVTAVNEGGSESAFSNHIEIIPNKPVNTALNKPTSSSSIYGNSVPEYTVDGQVVDYPYIWHSGRYDTDLKPWIRIDLQKTLQVQKIVIYNRANPGTYSRNRDFDLDILDENGILVWSNYDESTSQGILLNQGNWMNNPAVIDFIIPFDISGRYVVLTKRSRLVSDSATANIAEIEIFSGKHIAPVMGLSASAGITGIHLNWNDHSDPIVTYRIYRRADSQTDYVVLAESNVSMGYVDNDICPGVSYFYIVTAIDADGNESGYCNEQAAVFRVKADLNGDENVDLGDFNILSQQWLSEGSILPSADIAPEGGDNGVNFGDLWILVQYWGQWH
ncbi:MAG: discoidin domain-containing protein [Anaerohalosphaeraceae bacterium]